MTLPDDTTPSGPTFDEDAPTPDTVIVETPKGKATRPRGTASHKVYIEYATYGKYNVTVEVRDGEEAIFVERGLTQREVEVFLRGVDRGVFPLVLQLPDGWKID